MPTPARAPHLWMRQRRARVLTPADRRAVAMAIESIRGVPVTLPLFLNGLPFCWLRSDHTRQVWAATWTGMDSIVLSLQANNFTRREWVKQLGSLSPLTMKWIDLWCCGGKPQFGTYSGTADTLRIFDDTVAGGMAHGGNVSPSVKRVVGGYSMGVAASQVLWLYDRVGDYPSCAPLNGTITMTNSASTARYNGSGLPGCLVMPTIQNVFNSGTTYKGLNYVDQGGSASVAPVTAGTFSFDSHPSSASSTTGAAIALIDANNNNCPFSPLAAGDTGVRSITSWASDATDTTGLLCFALVRPIVMFAQGVTNGSGVEEFMHQEPELDAFVYDGAHLSFLTFIQGSAQQYPQGGIYFGWE